VAPKIVLLLRLAISSSAATVPVDAVKLKHRLRNLQSNRANSDRLFYNVPMRFQMGSSMTKRKPFKQRDDPSSYRAEFAKMAKEHQTCRACVAGWIY
jgi:hypothetical protein